MKRAVSRLAVVIALALAFVVGVVAQAPETVYVTKTGSKYHRAGCSSLRRSSIAMTLDAAAAKYQPCKICKPLVPQKTAATAPTTNSSPKAAPATQAVDLGRCQAITKKGTQCSRKAKPGSKYCWQHGG